MTVNVLFVALCLLLALGIGPAVGRLGYRRGWALSKTFIRRSGASV